MAKSYTAGPELQARLSAWAWEKCAEAADTGRVTLEDGQVIDLLDPDKHMQTMAKTVLAHVHWLAQLTAKKRPRTEMPRLLDSARLPETR